MIILLPEQAVHFLVDENGLIENAQVVLYAAGAIISLIYAKRKIWKDGLSGGLILVFFALRELDFHEKDTRISITNTAFYVSPDIWVSSKIFFGSIIVSILIIVLLFAIRNTKPLMTGLRNQKKWAIYAFTGIILIPVSVAVDKSLRVLKLLGISIGSNAYIIKTTAEEVTELGISVMLLTALVLFRRESDKQQISR